MDNVRIMLWLALLFVVWLNVDAWMKDRAPAEPPPAAASPAAQERDAGSPAASSGGQLADAVPTLTGRPEIAAAAADPGAGTVPPADQATVRVATDVLELEVALVGGDVIRADILRYPLRKENPGTPVRLFDHGTAGSRFLFQSGLTTGEVDRSEPNHKALFAAEAREYRLENGRDELRIPLRWAAGSGLTVTKTYTLRRGSYVVDIAYQVDNAGGQPVRLASYAQLLRHWEEVKRSMWDVESYAFRGPAIFDGEGYRKLDVEDEEDQALSLQVTNGWVGALQHHFVAAIVPAAGLPYQYELRVQDRDYLLRVVGPAQTAEPGRRLEFSERLFVGPKLQEQLEQAGPKLELTADYGKLTILAQPLFWLLSRVYELIGNWGWAIVLVTVLIKAVFYKLSETSGRSMAKMRTVAPRLKSIQERYKDDREGQARAMMELYKREKINPVAGCLPMLVQIPFFLAFYWVLLESVEMRQAPFMGWLQDLSVRDPYFILPLLMGGAMFLQFKLNPTPPDPVQAKVFAFMPVVMTVMFMWFPSGLVLYWLTNTLLSIAQQWKINRVVEAEAKKQRSG
ncbi:MAG: membrane protein insertase YidC [Gammaproteobacteria bacterium]|nr:membrane protein insertase YidC [Gammaproteobacteria bacterium]